MKCEEALQRVRPYIEDRLQPRELEEFLGHVKACPACYDELETYYIVSEAVRYLDDKRPETYNITEMLKKDIAAKEHRLRRRKVLLGLLLLGLALAAGLALLGALGYAGVLDIPFLPEN